MRTPVPEDLALLDRNEAVQRYSDWRNFLVLYVAASILIIESVATLVVAFMRRQPVAAIMASVLLTLAVLSIRVVRELRRAPDERRPWGAWEAQLLGHAEHHQRATVMILFLSIVALVTLNWSLHPDDDPLAVMILIVIALRVSVSERVMIHLALLLALFVASPFLPPRGLRGEEGPFWLAAVVYGSITLVSFLFGWFLTRRFVANFLANWEPARLRFREQVRMREELDLARTIQLSMLPREIPAAERLTVAAESRPATEVGGDFYDFYEHDGRFAIAAADVAGHGVGSAIVLSGVRSGLRLLRDHLERPAELMSRLDELVRETRSRRMLVSLCFLSIAPDRRSATVISAGHPPLLHWRSQMDHVDEILLPSLPLGSGLKQRFEVAEISLQPGDRLLLHTDGAYETRNARGEELGLDRLAQALGRGRAGEPPSETLARVLATIDDHRGLGEQEDDVTLIAIHVG